MIALLLRKTETLKMTQKKQQKFLVTAMSTLQRSLLENDPPQSAIVIPNVKMSYLKKIIESKKNHPSVATITENVLPDSLSFDLLPTSKEDINKIIKSLNASKVTGPDGVTLKLIQLSANFVDKYLTSFINHDILRSCFSLGAKTYLIRAIHKKKDRQNKGNYHPLSILNGFSTRSL